MMAGLTFGRSRSVLESPETGRNLDRCNVANKHRWNRKSFFHRSLDTQEQRSPFFRAHQLLAVPHRWTFCLVHYHVCVINSAVRCCVYDQRNRITEKPTERCQNPISTEKPSLNLEPSSHVHVEFHVPPAMYTWPPENSPYVISPPH